MVSEMETGRVDRHWSDRPAGRVEILRLAGQADQKNGQIISDGHDEPFCAKAGTIIDNIKKAQGAGPPREEAEGVTVRGPGDSGSRGFRIVRFRMQNSSAQTTACGRDDVFFFFYFGPKFGHLRTL